MLRHEFLHQNAVHLPHRARPFLDTIVFVEEGSQGLAEEVFILYEQARAGAYAPRTVYAEASMPATDAAVSEVFSILDVAQQRVMTRVERPPHAALPWAKFGGKRGTLSILLGAPIICALLLWLTDLAIVPTIAACVFASALLLLARAADAHYALALGARVRAFGRFAVTTSLIFAVLFVGLNYSAYWERFQYFLRSGSTSANTEEQTILEGLLTDAPAVPVDTVAAPTPPAPSALQSPDDVNLQANLIARQEALAFGDFPVAPPDDRLIIPKLGKNVPIVNTSDETLVAQQWDELESTIQRDLERGVVHYPGTAIPGQKGNVFLTGHSSYYAWSPGKYKSVFALLDQLVVGDQVIVYSRGEKYVYVAKSVEVVPPSRTDILSQPKDDSILTLMTCTPVGTAKGRLVIRFDQISPDPALNREPTSNDGTRIRSPLQA